MPKIAVEENKPLKNEENDTLKQPLKDQAQVSGGFVVDDSDLGNELDESVPEVSEEDDSAKSEPVSKPVADKAPVVKLIRMTQYITEGRDIVTGKRAKIRAFLNFNEARDQFLKQLGHAFTIIVKDKYELQLMYDFVDSILNNTDFEIVLTDIATAIQSRSFVDKNTGANKTVKTLQIKVTGIVS